MAKLKTDEILDQFRSLTIWNSGTERAPHKPLLVLWAIGRCLEGRDRLASYETIAPKLKTLLRDFGPHRKVYHPEDPFWRLQKDHVWEIDHPNLVSLTDSGGAHTSSLKRHNIHGGFTEPVFDALRSNQALAHTVAQMLLQSHFPTTLHDEIMRATGIGALALDPEPHGVEEIELEYVSSRRLKRKDGFRSSVLEAYENQCAVCEFAVRFDKNPIAIEAAHIQWHRAAGPAKTINGLSLCALHHKLFDKGVFTLLPSELKVIVSEEASGQGIEESLGRYHERKLAVLPDDYDLWPAPQYIKWHAKQVFKSPNQIFPS